jgi:hypothetical protein
VSASSAGLAAGPRLGGAVFAAACTAAATNRALRDGAEVVSLQASPMGEDIYRQLGFEEIFAYRLMGSMPG